MGLSFSPCILALLSLFILVSTCPVHAESASDQEIFDENPLRSTSRIDSRTANSSEQPTLQDLSRSAGYIQLTGTKGIARMFYYYFNSTVTNAPLVVYLMGGPGYSGAMAAFVEIGPYQITDKLSLVWNEYGWDKVANLLILDQPIGTCFSYSTNKEDIPTTSAQAADHLYSFIQLFFKKYPELAKLDLYITGESYAAHYISAFGLRVVQGNNHLEQHSITADFPIKLVGAAVGSAWAEPILQFSTIPEYALNMGLINQVQYNKILKPFLSCRENATKACSGTKYNLKPCADANVYCTDILWKYIITPLGGDKFNINNIRKVGNGDLGYDFSDMERYLNQTSVKTALGVDPKMPFDKDSDDVFRAMLGEQMMNSTEGIANLLGHGVKILIYVGENDLNCNPLGNLLWVNAMEWQGRKCFLSAKKVTFKVDDVDVGWKKNCGPLSFVMLKDAGHMVPIDQPKRTLEMLKAWLNETL